MSARQAQGGGAVTAGAALAVRIRAVDVYGNAKLRGGAAVDART